MSHTYAQNTLHVVFSTKDRRKLISKDLQPKMWAYISGICKTQNIFIHVAGGMEDHVHLLLQIPPVLALSKAILTIKSNSSRWASEQGHKFVWPRGLCRLQRERFCRSLSRSIHSQSGSTPQENELRRRIPRLTEKTRRCV